MVVRLDGIVVPSAGAQILCQGLTAVWAERSRVEGGGESVSTATVGVAGLTERVGGGADDSYNGPVGAPRSWGSDAGLEVSVTDNIVWGFQAVIWGFDWMWGFDWGGQGERDDDKGGKEEREMHFYDKEGVGLLVSCLRQGGEI